MTISAVQVIFADHNLGQAGGLNAALRACRGQNIVILDTSIELCGEIWSTLSEKLSDPDIGLVGPYGLVSNDLREFREAPDPMWTPLKVICWPFRRFSPARNWLAGRTFPFLTRLLDIHAELFCQSRLVIGSSPARH